MNIGERLKKLRKTLRLTQQKFADLIGIKRNTVGLIEIGQNNISNQLILSICRTFHVREKWLRLGEGDMFEPQNDLQFLVDDPTLDDMDKVILKKYIEFPPELRKVLKEFATHLAMEQTIINQKDSNLSNNVFVNLTRPEGLSDREWETIVKMRTEEAMRRTEK